MDLENGNKSKTEKDVIKIHKEDVELSKEIVDKGKTTLNKTVDTEKVLNAITLMHEDIAIEHIMVNKEVATVPRIREVGNVTIVPVMKEVAVVTKKLVLLKEIHITKKCIKTLEEVQTDLRTESVEIKKEH